MLPMLDPAVANKDTNSCDPAALPATFSENPSILPLGDRPLYCPHVAAMSPTRYFDHMDSRLTLDGSRRNNWMAYVRTVGKENGELPFCAQGMMLFSPQYSVRFAASAQQTLTHGRRSWFSIRPSITLQGRHKADVVSSLSDDAKWLQEVKAKPIPSRRVFKYLNLEVFTDEEIQGVFQTIQSSQENTDSIEGQDSGANTISHSQLQRFLAGRIGELEDVNSYKSDYDESTTLQFRENFAAVETDRCWNFLSEHSGNNVTTTMNAEEFSAVVKSVATSLDKKRVGPMILSMVLVGASVGVVTPAMPFVVQNLGLTAGEYGLIVSAFALSKMTGNIPSAVLVERHGRKPYLVYSMAIVALGVGGIGFANSFEELYVCRLATGLGVASLSTAITMTVTDISTPLNRASSFAPIMSAFSAGMVLGPAMGGFLVDYVGINETFQLVGLSYIGLAALNNFLIPETQPRPMTFPWQRETSKSKEVLSVRESFQNALGQWIPLFSNPAIRNVCAMNGFYWMSLAGSQMTLLPLILTDVDGLAMTATNVGSVYMGMSAVQVLGNPIFAKIVDTVGKVPGILGGCTLISSAMVALPFCNDMYQLGAAIAVWAAGSSFLSTAPISYVSDRVDDEKRAQAIALLRTTGDVGYLIGASSMGALADWSGSLDVAMHSSAAILLSATGWFAARNLLVAKLEGGKNPTP